ncbi:MAG TPA: hypothetical protein VGG07_01530 [Solirubrobacteraceae bacterium]
MSWLPAGIMARIRQVKHALTGSETTLRASSGDGQELSAGQVGDLRARLAHLEQLVQGLQDSVHRASERHDRRMSDIERRLDPAALAAALNQDERDRGL